MNRFFLLSLFILLLHSAHAIDPRDLLQRKAGPQQVKEFLLDKSEWIKYPAYSNRQGWDQLTFLSKDKLIKDGETYLNYLWKVVPASAYLEYEKSGSRTVMENPYNANNKALSTLVFAELAEGKGRFMNQVIDGVWQLCDMSSWALSAHLPVQQTRRNLPDYHEQIIDLVSGDMGSFLSWTWYFFHEEFDKINPIISSRILKLIRERILRPYMERSDYWWQAMGKPGVLVNNWNPWCNSNVLACFLLTEDNKDSLAAAVYKTMQSTDQFINYVKEDGACEEGPSYWTHAAGKLYDYLQLLSNATNGRISLFDEPMIRRMGEYISRSYVGDGWVVNFADASAKGGEEEELIYRYGKAVGSVEMCSYSAYLFQRHKEKMDPLVSRDFFRSIENIGTYPSLKAAAPALADFRYTWYPQTEVVFLRNKQGVFFAAKGGFNNESHNHNDVGTFSLYLHEIPFLIDAGVGTYTRQTFGAERYTIWTMQSDYHNVPKINGSPQPYGAAFKATNVQFDSLHDRFSLDLSKAYPQEALVKKWSRSFRLYDNKLLIDEEFELGALQQPNRLNFLSWSAPDISKAGVVRLERSGKVVIMEFDPTIFDAAVEEIKQEDPRLSNVWGAKIYRLSLVAKKQVLKGKYIITLNW